MSNVAYDLDTSGGLMPLIRALIKPPDEDAQKPKKPQHPYYKRPGKGHNHDSCDACGEGGDLICCDRCPASFHLGCYDPPLDEDDIPAGQWLCKHCSGTEEKPTSSRSSRAQSPADNKSDNEKRRPLRNNRCNSKNKEKEKKEDEKKAELEKVMTPMETLVKAAKIMNPTQFELPREMRVPCPFPGTDKEDGSAGPTVVSVDAWGCVPLPAKSCFVCRATCKLAPLLQCDYCPLLFHQDCLEPPLTALPTGRWMCPNHVEQYIDWKLVNSISASERVALWDRFSAPVDQHAIKIAFLRRARNRNPAFRIKVPVYMRGRVCVPDMVRYHYEHPASLLPSRREHVRCKQVIKKLNTGNPEELFDDDKDVTDKDQICLNLECAAYSGGRCGHDKRPARVRPSGQQPATTDDTASDLVHIQRKIEASEDSTSDLSECDYEYPRARVKRRRRSSDELHDLAQLGGELGGVEGVGAKWEQLAKRQLDKLDGKVIMALAWQRLQQVLSGEALHGAWRQAGGEGAGRAQLARLGLRRVALPSELLPRAERERIARSVWGEPPAAAHHPPHSSPALHVDSLAPIRAALCPVDLANNGVCGSGGGSGGGGASAGAGATVMRLSRLSCGAARGCELALSGCDRLSPLHAVIFYDEVTRQFELINYSEWGTLVNGVLYTCDVSHQPQGQGPATEQAPPDALHDLIGDRAHSRRINGSLFPSRYSCACGIAPPVPPGAAWEGTALVGHGALLQFGCKMYVFSVPHHHQQREPAM